MIPDSVLTRISPSKKVQTITLWPNEFAVLKKDDSAMCENYRITVVDKEEIRKTPSLATYSGTFASEPE
jgi:hypothetical protein